jgi:hypothetical protein
MGRRLRSSKAQPIGKGRAAPGGMNWRGRLNEWVKYGLDAIMFPDVRKTWLKPAEHVLTEWMRENKPDLVITSHEPAVSLILWLRNRCPDVAWIADLGDPVLSPYTRAQWKKRAFAVERKTVEHADALMVTNEATRDLLLSRHGGRADIEVIPQGFADSSSCREYDNECSALRLLYTGRFYSFRDGRALFEAVAGAKGVILQVATPSVTPLLASFAARYPDSFRVLGGLPHHRVLRFQEECDVLVCLGNKDSVQTPGKVYEYLGSKRPILYVRQALGDPVGKWIEAIRRGWQCDGDSKTLTNKLRELSEKKESGVLLRGVDLSFEAVREHSWEMRGRDLVLLCERVLQARASGRQTTERKIS